VSPNQGRRGQGRKGARGRGGKGDAPKESLGPAAVRRFGLMVFGGTFLILFIAVAIAEGIGDPSVPDGDVAVVEDAPGDVGEVTQARFDHALLLTATQAGEKEAPKSSDPKYDELKEATLKELFQAIWLQGLADELGIEASEKEIAAELKKIKKESFPTEAAFEEFKKKSKYTDADIDERVKLQILSKQLENAIKEGTPTPSQSEIEDYYEAAKSSQFTQKPSRDIRQIVNKDRGKAEEARDALSKDDTDKNWEKVAGELSEDPTTKGSGGLQEGVQKDTIEEPLNKAVFRAPEGAVEGPLKTGRGFIVFEVESSNPESVQELKAVEGQIQSTLAQRAEQEYFQSFVVNFTSQWTSRTFCAADYTTQECANFESDGHPATAPPGCYEEDPPGGLPEACPAPVFQLIPAQPGSVTPLEPQGKPLAQRPRPQEEEGGPAGATGAPQGAVPPPAGAPSE
jgi:foldase protein PrsA